MCIGLYVVCKELQIDKPGVRMKISVAICTYNGARFLREQLNSILNQKLPVNEIVLCDDISTDRTLHIVDECRKSELGKQISWIVKVNETRLGVRDNFAKAMGLCSGDYIFLSDQDDIWREDKTELMVNYLNNHPNVDLLFTDAKLIDENDRNKWHHTLFDVCGLRQLMEQWNAGLQFEIENVIQRLLGATFLMRKAFCLRCLPFCDECVNYHDGQIAMRAVVEGTSALIDECLIYYRIHDNNVVGLGGKKNLEIRGAKKNPELAILVEPREINLFFLKYTNGLLINRVCFYKKRNKNYRTLFGKIILILYVFTYIKLYKRWWWRFFCSDLLYGVNNSLRMSIVNM